MTRGRFIVLEGGEGSGKTTQARLLVERLRDSGDEVVATFEPGATKRGAAIRSALLDDRSPLSERAELFLMNADRAQHVIEVIEPALARGAIVVCDRHTPSTIVYQGVGRELGVELVAGVCALATGDVLADRVIVIDVSDETAGRRVTKVPDRIEAAGVDFHRAVRAAYRELAPRFGWVVVDGNGTERDTSDRIWSEVEPLMRR